MLADQVHFIEQAKLSGRPVMALAVYDELVDRWLERDAGKHSLLPDHKRLLMENIAARLARDGRISWSANEIADWLVDFMNSRPDVTSHYSVLSRNSWSTDLRTATFLARAGDAFSFAHRSLYEYFLARHLFRAISGASTLEQAKQAWAVPLPSQETLDFLGQAIHGCPPEQRSSILDTVARLSRGDSDVPSTALATEYVDHARRRGNPWPAPVGDDPPHGDASATTT